MLIFLSVSHIFGSQGTIRLEDDQAAVQEPLSIQDSDMHKLESV